SNNTIGGTTPGAGNVISGNQGLGGILIQSAGTSSNVVAGNYIGTDASGTAKLGNATAGVTIELGASGNTVGGTSSAARNVISGNAARGVDIEGSGTTGNVVQGNLIGLAADGKSLGNGTTGLQIIDAPGNTIGGTAAGAGNVISGNSGSGLGIS